MWFHAMEPNPYLLLVVRPALKFSGSHAQSQVSLAISHLLVLFFLPFLTPQSNANKLTFPFAVPVNAFARTQNGCTRWRGLGFEGGEVSSEGDLRSLKIRAADLCAADENQGLTAALKRGPQPATLPQRSFRYSALDCLNSFLWVFRRERAGKSAIGECQAFATKINASMWLSYANGARITFVLTVLPERVFHVTGIVEATFFFMAFQ